MAAPTSSASSASGSLLGTTRHFDRPLRVRDLVVRAATRRHLPAALAPDATPPLGLTVTVASSRVPPSRPNRFSAVTGAPYDGRTLPPTFAATLFVAATLRMLTDEAFPLTPLGWVRVQQTFREEAMLLSHHSVALRLTLRSLAPTPAGPALRLEQSLTTQDRPVWTGTTTLLRPVVPGQRGEAAAETSPTSLVREMAAKGDVGLRFAWATGDGHPHRLTPRTARPLGYADPIAHEAWLLARAHALLADRFPKGARLAGSFSFPSPFVLPGEAQLHAGALQEESGALDATLHDSRSGSCLLRGTFSIL